MDGPRRRNHEIHKHEFVEIQGFSVCCVRITLPGHRIEFAVRAPPPDVWRQRAKMQQQWAATGPAGQQSWGQNPTTPQQSWGQNPTTPQQSWGYSQPGRFQQHNEDHYYQYGRNPSHMDMGPPQYPMQPQLQRVGGRTPTAPSPPILPAVEEDLSSSTARVGGAGTPSRSNRTANDGAKGSSSNGAHRPLAGSSGGTQPKRRTCSRRRSSHNQVFFSSTTARVSATRTVGDSRARPPPRYRGARPQHSPPSRDPSFSQSSAPPCRVPGSQRSLQPSAWKRGFR